MSFYEPPLPRAYQRRYPSTPRSAGDLKLHEAIATDLCHLLHLWPAEVDLSSPAGRRFIDQQLRRALRGQRRHAISGHWSYDIACHARLLELHRQLEFYSTVGRRTENWPDRSNRIET